MSVQIATDQAPAAVGPYSQAVRAGDFIFLSGQIPLDPQSGELVGDTTAEQTEQVFKNIAAVLKAAELTYADVVSVTVYLTNMADFQAVNMVYARYFEGGVLPARCALGIAALPKGAAVEIACTAYAGKA
ncbi:MAG: Rid family detoxifying hydrolase [Sporolactobacillus sp.]